MPADNEQIRSGVVDALAYMTAYLDGQDALETPAEHEHFATMQEILRSQSDPVYGVALNLAHLFKLFAEDTAGLTREQFRAWLGAAGRFAATNHPDDL